MHSWWNHALFIWWYVMSPYEFCQKLELHKRGILKPPVVSSHVQIGSKEVVHNLMLSLNARLEIKWLSKTSYLLGMQNLMTAMTHPGLKKNERPTSFTPVPLWPGRNHPKTAKLGSIGDLFKVCSYYLYIDPLYIVFLDSTQLIILYTVIISLHLFTLVWSASSYSMLGFRHWLTGLDTQLGISWTGSWTANALSLEYLENKKKRMHNVQQEWQGSSGIPEKLKAASFAASDN